jgi:hypothetical protein
MNNVMIDLETMGVNNNAAIIAIGAVAFDFEGNLGNTFYKVINLESSVIHGGVIDAPTVLWWMKQNDLARREFEREGEFDSAVLVKFAGYLDDFEDVKVWGNGAAFDNVILANAYRRNMMSVPWNHWNDRCYRTMKSLHPDIKMEREGVYHNALADAISQAKHLQRIMKK